MSREIPSRPLGRTGIEIPILGFGTAEGGMGLPSRRAVRLYREAFDRGFRFFDTAPGYGNAQKLLPRGVRAIREARSSVIIASKAPTSKGDELTKIMEQNLKTLRTDYLDIAYIHSVGSCETDELLGPGGSLEALVDLKRKGHARFIGFSAHHRPGESERVLRSSAEIDVVMLALNPVETHIYDFERRVVPLAKERGVGVIAMKLYGGAPDMVYKKPVPSALEARERGNHEMAFRYALSESGVSSAVIGMYRLEEIEKNLEYLERFRPLTNDERAGLLEWGHEASVRWGPRYGPVE